MPFINTMTNVKITQEKEAVIKARYGKALSALGKTESWLMLNFEDESRMWFKGMNDRKLAMVEVSLFGKATSAGYEKMTAEVTGILCSELGLDPDCVYVKYDEISAWGWNGGNF